MIEIPLLGARAQLGGSQRAPQQNLAHPRLRNLIVFLVSWTQGMKEEPRGTSFRRNCPPPRTTTGCIEGARAPEGLRLDTELGVAAQLFAGWGGSWLDRGSEAGPSRTRSSDGATAQNVTFQRHDLQHLLPGLHLDTELGVAARLLAGYRGTSLVRNSPPP